MADKAKVVTVEKLGDVCAFKPKGEIQVLKSVYDKVPADKREDFEAALITARTQYEKMVADAKKAGHKPRSAAFKAEVVENVVKAFLTKNGVEVGKASKGKAEKTERVVEPTEPKVTDAKDQVKVETTEAEQKQAEQYYDNNFPEDALDDSEGAEKKEEVELGGLSDDFDMDDDFDFEGLDGEQASEGAATGDADNDEEF